MDNMILEILRNDILAVRIGRIVPSLGENIAIKIIQRLEIGEIYSAPK